MIITGGTVVDGTGGRRYGADIRVLRGRIYTIGACVPRRDEEVIRAEGRFVVPGFVWSFAHGDHESSFLSPSAQERVVRQGITTMVLGAGGYSLAPFLHPQEIAELHTNAHWQTMDEYLTYLSSRSLLCNIATYMGYEMIQGLRDNQQKHLMRARSMRAGAVGISYKGTSQGNVPALSPGAFLRTCVRENKQYSWEEAIHRLAAFPAHALGIEERGVLRKGYRADIAIFDPLHISEERGISRVLVNGGLRGFTLRRGRV